jgi:hypothetical protein
VAQLSESASLAQPLGAGDTRHVAPPSPVAAMTMLVPELEGPIISQ